MNTFKAAVIIITKDRPEDIKHCVDTLLQCNPMWHQVIVVDASEAEKAEQNQKHLLKLGDLLTYTQSQPGSSLQRNKALQMVDDDIEAIMFIDDDVDVAANTIEVAGEYLRAHPEVVGITGTLHGEIEHHASWISKVIGSFTQMYTSRVGTFTYGLFNINNAAKNTQQVSWLPGGFCVLRWPAIADYRFDEWFEKNGLAEDFEYSYRLQAAGELHVVPALEGRHLKSESARNWERYGRMRIANRNYIRKKHFSGDVRYFVGYWWSNAWLLAINTLRAIWSQRHRQEVIGEWKGVFALLLNIKNS